MRGNSETKKTCWSEKWAHSYTNSRREKSFLHGGWKSCFCFPHLLRSELLSQPQYKTEGSMCVSFPSLPYFFNSPNSFPCLKKEAVHLQGAAVCLWMSLWLPCYSLNRPAPFPQNGYQNGNLLFCISQHRAIKKPTGLCVTQFMRTHFRVQQPLASRENPTEPMAWLSGRWWRSVKKSLPPRVLQLPIWEKMRVCLGSWTY